MQKRRGLLGDRPIIAALWSSDGGFNQADIAHPGEPAEHQCMVVRQENFLPLDAVVPAYRSARRRIAFLSIVEVRSMTARDAALTPPRAPPPAERRRCASTPAATARGAFPALGLCDLVAVFLEGRVGMLQP
jgi:hypothetical protein